MVCRRFACAVLVLLAVSVGAARVDAAGPAPIFRVFLKNGTPLVCWGEYARVGDRLVLTIPIGVGPRAAYEFVSIPVERVDMDRTERYAEAVRAAQFAAGRGKAEFAELSDRLAAQLATIETLPDPKARLEAAERARTQLLDWAETSHGYRAKEVQQLAQMFDSAIIDLRVAAGESRFSISLSAGLIPDAPVKLRAAPTTRETIDLAMKAARVADSPEGQLALLRRARAAANALPAEDPRTDGFKAATGSAFAEAVRIDTAYRRLDQDVRRLADSAADRGDVLAIEALRTRVIRTDLLLGHQRAADVTALMAALDLARDAAAEERLSLDHWEALHRDLVAYQKSAAGPIATLDALAPTLQAIRQMSGPPLTALVTAERQTTDVMAKFSALVAPEGVSAAHSLLALAIEQSDLAVRTRRRAVETRQLPAAREASDAAADALVRLAQGKDALAAALKPPKAIR